MPAYRQQLDKLISAAEAAERGDVAPAEGAGGEGEDEEDDGASSDAGEEEEEEPVIEPEMTKGQKRGGRARGGFVGALRVSSCGARSRPARRRGRGERQR